METISRSLLTFLLNSLWQIPLAALVAALACGIMRGGPASHRHAVWVAALVAAVLVPLASVRRGESTPGVEYSAALADPGVGNPTVRRAAEKPAPIAVPVARTISFAATTASVVLGAYFLFVFFRLARLGWSSVRTVQIRGKAQEAAVPDTLARVWLRCQEAFGLRGVPLLVSAEVSGPVAAGGVIILPESMLRETSEDVLTTAVGHEMAHVARRDFAFNLIYEILHLPIGFHPAAWLIRREIERTREMACDEMVTHRLLDAGVYARSIMSIASGMMALPKPGYTLGVFDGDILEARIRRLVERPAANFKRARLLLATGLGALVLCAVIASSVALTARAQGSADELMKQAEAAFNRHDFKAAAELSQSAVQVDSANLKAKLLLADSLLSEQLGLPERDPAVLARARQQYVDVMKIEPANKQALQGMVTLEINTKQFAEGHSWALKAIQADATDKASYYTAGFADWAMTYPDYAQARLAAGLKPWDPGIIPDAAARQKLRLQHGADIEDGFRMLQVALQLDPDYSDAMAYMNLLYRIQAGIADNDAQYADYTAKADAWVRQALDAKKRQAQNPKTAAGARDGSGSIFVAPPPPPPPPPPMGARPGNPAEVPQRIVLEGPGVQGKLVQQARPVYPAAAKEAGISGVVRLGLVIGKDGKVADIKVMNGPGHGLEAAAMEAVRQWVYHPTLLNGQPVEVVTTVEVRFDPLSGQ